MSNAIGGMVARIGAVRTNEEGQQNIKDTEYLNNITKQIYDFENIEVKTELNAHQINIFTKALTFADIYNLPVIENFVNRFMILSLSKDRKSRKEMTDIAKSLMAQSNSQEESGLLGHLMGK